MNGSLMSGAIGGDFRRHCERSEAIQHVIGFRWMASSLRSSQ
jgi:hypothetical protein